MCPGRGPKPVPCWYRRFAGTGPSYCARVIVDTWTLWYTLQRTDETAEPAAASGRAGGPR